MDVKTIHKDSITITIILTCTCSDGMKPLNKKQETHIDYENIQYEINILTQTSWSRLSPHSQPHLSKDALEANLHAGVTIEAKTRELRQ